MKTQELQHNLEQVISAYIAEAFGLSHVAVELSIPTDKTKADLVTNVSFLVAKEAKQSPVVIAEKIATHCMSDQSITPYFACTASAPGFINISVTDAFLNLLCKDIASAQNSFGSNATLAGQTYVIEHTSPNPNKAMHVGHLRNNLTGMALVRICKASGARVVSEAVDNNRGIAIAKAMWGYLISKKKDGTRVEDVSYWAMHTDEWYTPSDLSQKPDHFVDECYLKGSEDFKNNPASEVIVRDMVVKWEHNEPHARALWEIIIGYAHEGMESTLNRIGNKWDIVWHEHEHYTLGKELVLQGLKKGVFSQLEDGAILTHLESYNLPDTILLKSDGTSLYITQDIALTHLKKEKHKADKLIWVIGPEQGVAMKQVFACCEQLGIGAFDDFVHIPYGLINILGEDGKVKKMSSRGGEVVHIDTLIDEVKQTLLNAGRDYSPELAETIAIGAIKYSILRASRTTNVVLDIEHSINLTGDSGVYLMYAYARIKSLLAKANTVDSDNFSFDEYEKRVMVTLLHFPFVIKNALKDYAPNLIIEYMLELSQVFNTAYAQEKFISEDIALTNKKIALTHAVATVLAVAFNLVGIEVPERV